MQGYQLGPQVLTKLPPFQLSADGDLRNGAHAPASLQGGDMGLLAVYGRVYCYLIRRAALGVSLYRFYKCELRILHRIVQRLNDAC